MKKNYRDRSRFPIRIEILEKERKAEKRKDDREEVWSQSRKRLNCLTTRIMQMGRRSAHASSNSFVPWNYNRVV